MDGNLVIEILFPVRLAQGFLATLTFEVIDFVTLKMPHGKYVAQHKKQILENESFPDRH